MLPSVIAFGANAEGAPVLAAMQALPDVLAYRSRLPAPLIPGRLIDAGVVNGPWRRLVFGHPAHEDGAVSRHAYTFCVLEQFWRHLKRREIYADASTRWRNPQAQLLEGEAWEAVRGDVLTTLGLPDDPDALLAEHARALDAAYREVGGRLAVNTEVTRRRRREDPPDRGEGRRGAAVAGRPAQPDHGDAAARRPARGDPGGDVLGAGARRRRSPPRPAAGPGWTTCRSRSPRAWPRTP